MFLNSISMKPPLKLGIVGGGQLGKMMTVAAKNMGIDVTVFDPEPSCPAGQVADRQIVANYDDARELHNLARQVDTITYEFEHIDAEKLISLEGIGFKIFPQPTILKNIQNKLTQKSILASAGIPVPSFSRVKDRAELDAAIKKFGLPLLLKTTCGGYDGKGNFLIRTEDEIELAFKTLGDGQVELMAEEFVDFSMEVSVMVARDVEQNIISYPLVENIHKDNILIKTIAPARVGEETLREAEGIAHRVVSVFSGIGIFGVEMFVTQNGEIIVNEVAPRPHNSGHYTIEACVVSQFEQHVRAVMGMPLGSTEQLIPAVMINILGECGCTGNALLTGVDEMLKIDGASLHLYGKIRTAPLRKMGHVTIVGKKIDDLLCKANIILEKVKVIAS